VAYATINSNRINLYQWYIPEQ